VVCVKHVPTVAFGPTRHGTIDRSGSGDLNRWICTPSRRPAVKEAAAPTWSPSRWAARRVESLRTALALGATAVS